MTISFDAASWAKAAGAFDDAAGGVRGFSASMSPGGGATQSDAAIASAVARLVAGFTSAVNGLAGGLAGDAEAMRATGANYAAQEAANARGGATLRQA